MNNGVLLWFWFSLSWLLNILNPFSYYLLAFLYFPFWSDCSSLLHIFSLDLSTFFLLIGKSSLAFLDEFFASETYYKYVLEFLLSK